MESASQSDVPRTENKKHGESGNGPGAEPSYRLKRWLVYFRSGPEWYAVGEFLAADNETAIERAVEVFGGGQAHRAEEIPWDAAPLHKECGYFRPASTPRAVG